MLMSFPPHWPWSDGIRAKCSTQKAPKQVSVVHYYLPAHLSNLYTEPIKI